MPEFPEADTIRILVATDNHIGYEERDAIRKDDSWRTFDEIMTIARTQDVDMVLLAGDLFHDNKPSRKSLYQVIRTLRKNCLGMKPCPLEFLSDAAEVFQGAFPHVNYEDPDINISIPVFSIHGNHDDPSGDGNYCSLDLLQAAGLLNYYGRVPEVDNIEAKPILLQKGDTKLALYGLSNVRDERMFRTFRDHKVKWYRPGQQTGEWFNLLAVHQNHHAHTATSYLPENVLPDWLDLVVWGHEHECLIDPTKNPETGFHVMQPGSSVATSLVPGEAVAKHVAVVSVNSKSFKVDKIPLKTVRPFVTRDISLSHDKRFKGLDKKKDNKHEVTRLLMEIVEEMIATANAEWEAIQTDEEALEERPLPLIRLRVEYTAPEGGEFECENPQRFSNRFLGKVANTNDVVYYYRSKKSSSGKKEAKPADILEALGDDATEMVKVESLVNQLLAKQSLKVLPQGPFGEAVNQFVAKDDKHAMELFVSHHLSNQVKQMMNLESDDEDLNHAMQLYKEKAEQMAAASSNRKSAPQERKRVLKPKPATWDSDFDGNWEDEPNAWEYEDAAEEDEPPARPRAAGRSSRKTQQDDEMLDVDEEEPPPAETKKATTRAPKAPAKKAPAKKAPAKKAPARRGRDPFEDSEEEEEEPQKEFDEVMDSDEGEAPPPPYTATRVGRGRNAKPAAAASKPAATRKTPARGAAAKSRQTKLNFSQGATQDKALEISDDEVSDDDAFEPAPVASRTRKR
ncbi:Metallo-dependent phosphatase-like protein [Trichoderma longibrachiatum]